MRVIGIVTEVRQPSGLYMREGVAEAEVVADAYRRWAQVGAAAAAAVVGGLTVAAFIPTVSLGSYLYEKLFAKPKPLVPVPGLFGGSAGLPSDRAIVIPSTTLAGQYGDYDAPLFHGLFASKSELRTVMEAEGGNVDLIIVDQATANTAFGHYLGGSFSTGIHLPHPKDPAVLIPSRRYASELLREVHAEWVQTLEALGAKSIVIGDATAATAKAGGSKVLAGIGSVGAEMRARYDASHVDESTYAPGTFDPARAVTARRWLRDYPEILSIVEGRVHGNQASWRRSIKVNAEFGVSAEVLGVFKAGLDGGFARTYDFAVEFYPKD